MDILSIDECTKRGLNERKTNVKREGEYRQFFDVVLTFMAVSVCKYFTEYIETALERILFLRNEKVRFIHRKDIIVRIVL